MPARVNKERPKRARVSGYRDIITVEGKDPDFYYRWVHDTGHRIQRYLDAGFQFVDAEKENLVVGEAKVGKRIDIGSVYTMPYSREDNDDLLYLMKQPMEFRLEDEAAKEKELLTQEASMFRRYDPDSDAGQYGEVKISRN